MIIVGTSFHENNCRSLFGKRNKHNFGRHMALLEAESNIHDPNAIKVSIRGKKVGHIKRELTPLFKSRLPLKVIAIVSGGWNNDRFLWHIELLLGRTTDKTKHEQFQIHRRES